MASNVSNALGTERQFAKQPERVYTKQLISPNMNSGMSYDDTAGARLSRILNEWADDIPRIMKHREARTEEYDKKRALEIINSPENIGNEGLTAQAMFANAGRQDLLDSPYAMSVVEEYRGENAMRAIQQRYLEEVVQQEGRCPTRKEELDRWNNFVKEKRKEYDMRDVPYSEDTQSYERFFNIGFYKDYEKYSEREIAAQTQVAADNRQAILTGTTTAKFGEAFSPENLATKSSEDIISDFTNISKGSIAGGMPLSVLAPLQWKALQLVSANGGTPELIDKLGEAQAYVNPDATPVYVKDIFDMPLLREGANEMQLARRNKEQQDLYNLLKDSKTLDEYDANLDKLKKDNPAIFTLFAKKGWLTSLRDQKEREIEMEKRRATLGRNSIIGRAKNQMDVAATLADGDGWWSALKAGAVQYKGIPRTKYLSMTGKTDLERIMIGNDQASKIVQRGVKDNDMRSASNDMMLLLNSMEMSPFKKSYNEALNTTLANLVSVNLDDIDASDPRLRDVQMACNMYHANPTMAKITFGDDIYKKLERINALSDNSEAYWKQDADMANSGLIAALKQERAVAPLLDDPTSRAVIDKKYQDAVNLEDARFVSVANLDGSGYIDGIDFTSDPYYSKRIPILAETNIALGIEPGLAIQKAEKEVVGETYSYYGVTLPKAMLFGIEADDQAKALREAINTDIAEMGGNVVFAYDSESNSITFSAIDGAAPPRTYTHQQYIDRASGLHAAYETKRQQEAESGQGESEAEETENKVTDAIQDYINSVDIID